jgi:hypothetical protein
MYEFKYQFRNGSGWKDLDELHFMDRLYVFYRKLSPVIKTLLSGKVLKLEDGEYRIIQKSK